MNAIGEPDAREPKAFDTIIVAITKEVASVKA